VFTSFLRQSSVRRRASPRYECQSRGSTLTYVHYRDHNRPLSRGRVDYSTPSRTARDWFLRVDLSQAVGCEARYDADRAQTARRRAR